MLANDFFFFLIRDGSHGVHIHETYYGDRDTDTLILVRKKIKFLLN